MMTEDRSRKKAIRARMATSGEPYSVAARHHAEGRPPDDGAAVSEIIACAARTLEAPSARMALGHEWQSLPSAGEFGPAARLIGAAARAVWRRIAPAEADLRRGDAVGFAEPAAGRYMIDSGWGGETCDGGVTFTGRPGRPVAGLRPERESGDSLWLLRLVPGVTEADFEATETLRGTACRRFAVLVDSARAAAASLVRLRKPMGVSPELPPMLPLTVWTGGQYVRQVRLRDQGPATKAGPPAAVMGKVYTLELWDFGVSTGHLDWSRIPDFRDAGGPAGEPG